MSRLLPLFAFLLLVGLFGFGIWWNTQHDQHEIVTGDVSLGANYLELCLMASMQGAPHAGAARAGEK